MPGRFVFDDEEATIKPSGRFVIEPTPEEARATAEGVKADVLRGIGYPGAAPAPVMRPLSDVAAVGQNFGIVHEIGRQLVGGMTDVGGAVGLGLQSMGRLLDRASAPSRTTGDMALGAGDTAILASGAEIPTPGIAARITKPVSERLKATGKEVGGYWGDAGEQYQQSTDIQGSVVKKPELLANPKWWASNIARMTPGLAASLMVSYATGGGSLLAGAGKSTARTVGGLLGGIAGGLMEGQGTEREALKRGMSEDEAIDAGMKMTAVAGILNAISLDSMLNPSARKWLARFLISGSTEAVTEYGEEPAEGIILGEDWETFKKRLIDGVNVLGPAFFTGGPAAVLAGGNAGPEQADTPPLAPRTEQKQAEIPTPPPPAPPQTGPAAQSARAFMRHWVNQAADEKNLADVTEQARQVNQSPQGAEGLRIMLMKEEERGILEERRARRNADIEASNQLADEAIRARKATPEDMAEYGKTLDEGLANQRQAKRLVNETITGERREALKTLRNDVYDAMRSGEIEFEELPALAESYRKDGLKPEADLIDEIFTRPRAAEQKKTGRVADETVLAPEPQQNKAMPPADETGSAKSETSAGAPNVLNQPATAVTDGPRLISAPVVSQETQPGERQTTKTITDETQTYGLGEREQAFIRDKVKKFGSRDAAMKFYGGKSPVDMFGRYVADQVYGKKSALGITPRKNASTQQSEQSPTTAAPEIIDTVRRNGKRYKVIKHADGRMEIYRKHGGTEERHAYDMDGYRQDKERMTKAADRTSGSKKKYIHISANKLGPAARILLGKGIKRATGADLGELVDLWDGIRVVGHRTVDPQAQAQEDRWVAEWADHEGVPQGVTFEDMLAEAHKEIKRAISKNTETQGETHPGAMAEREADQRKEWLDMGLTNDDITNILATEGDMQSNALDLLASRGQFTEKVLNGYRNEGFTDEDIADIRAGQNPADIRSSIRQALQDGLQDGLDETAQAIRGVSGEEREDPSSTPGGAEEFFAGLAEATATPTSEAIFTEQAPRTIPADRTTALFDTKDARTGEPIAAGEIVYFLTDTKETVKESTYRGMTERAAQGELFAPKAAGKKPAEDKAEKQKPTPAQSLEFTTEPIRNTEAAQTSMLDEMDGQGDLFAEDRGKKTRIAEPRADRTDVITPEGTVIVDGYVVDTETGEVTGEVLPNGSIESLKRETPSKAVSGRKADTVEDVKNIFPKATGVTRNDDGSYTVNVGKKSIMYRPAPGTAFLLDETGKSRYIPSKKGGEDDRSIEPDADNRRHENAGAKIEKPSAERIGSAIRSIARDIGVSPGGITETSAPSREDSGLAVRVAHIFGHYPVFIKTEEEGIFTVIGVAHDDIVFINGETDHPHVHVVSHEIVHALRKKHPDLYQKLYEAVHEDAIAFDRFLQKERAAMPWALNDYIAHEFVAYTVSERMYERGFWRNLYAKIPDVVRNILNSLNRIINTIALDPKYKTNTYFKDIQKVRDTIDSVMTEYARRENNADEPRFMTRPLTRAHFPRITGPAVERAVNEIAGKFNVPVRVVATAAELPAEIRDAAQRRQSEGDVVLGIYHGGKVWIVAEHMRSADEARKVFIHEAVGHYGLRKVMGKDFEAFLDFLVNDTKYGAEIKAFAKEYGISDPREAADEWFARQSETMKPNSSLWSRFMFHVRKWLRSLGATIEYGKPELVELLRVSREAARKGGRITAGAGVRYRGYDWDAGKSNNAVDAEASGRYPASKVAKMLGVPIEVVRAFDTQEYHHTGKYFNTTKYYDVDEVRDWVNDPDNADEIARIKAESKATAPAIESTGHTVAWLEWSGTRNHPKATTVTEKNVTIEDTGGKFLNIITSDGNTIRKGRDTKGFEIDGRPAYLFKIKTAEQSSERPVPPRSKTSGEVKGVQKDRDGRITQPDAGVKGKIPDEDADPDIRFSTRLSAAATRSTDAVISDYKRTSAIGKALTPISTALERIHPRLKYGKNNGLRGVESRIAIRIREDTQSVLPLLQSVKKKIRDKADIKAWDLARKNSDEAGILRIVKKYGLGAEYGKYRMMEDGIFKRAREAGYSVKYLKEHWARMIRDEEGFLKYLHNTTEWGMIDEAIKAAEEKGKKLLSDREKAVIANRVLRGPTIEQVNLPTPGNVKKRTIREIDDELNKYYFDADTSVLKYIELMNKNIEARKYFGVGPKADVSPMDPLMDEQLDESIGMFVAKQRQELHLTPEKENELVAVLRARFNYRPLGGMFQHIKELGYLTAMGSGISSTITQLGDIPYAFYIAPKDAARAMMRAFKGKSPVDVYGLGIERIAEEFSDLGKLGKALRVIFKGIGLAKMDTVFKETLVNAAVAKMQRQAREGNIDEDLQYRIDAIFGSEKDAVIADLKANRISEDVKLLAFNILCDFQPVALSEMPAEYLSGETGGKLSRLFYMMKTYTIKQMDVIRREAIWDIKRGNYARGSARFASLIATLILANMSADAIKDWIFRRRTDLSDLVVDNILKLVGISRYLTWSFRTDGIKMSIARLLLPPTDVIELPVKDVWSAGKAIKEGEEFDVRELQSLRMIPVAGQMYHWWFGGGKASRIKRDRTMILKDIEQYYQKPDKARAEKLIAQMKEYNAHAPKDKKITKRTLSAIQARVKRERRIR